MDAHRFGAVEAGHSENPPHTAAVPGSDLFSPQEQKSSTGKTLREDASLHGASHASSNSALVRVATVRRNDSRAAVLV